MKPQRVTGALHSLRCALLLISRRLALPMNVQRFALLIKPQQFALVLWVALAQSAWADEPQEPAATRKIVSSSPACWAITDASTHVTTAYRKTQKGKPVALWSAPGWFRVAELSTDCKYLVTGYDGRTLLPAKADGELVMLSFYADGKIVRRIRLKELICDWSHLNRTASHWAWGNYIGVEKDFQYRIETEDRGALVFDMRTGNVLNKPSLACKSGEARHNK